MQYIMRNVNLTFLRKNKYLQQRGQKLNTRLDTAQVMQWNQILKNYANGLIKEQNCLQYVSLLQKCVHLQKKI